MPIADWSVPFEILSPTGEVLLNQPTNVSGEFCRYQLVPSACAFGPTLGETIQRLERLRATKDNVPQADGSILHHRFLPGMVMNLAIEFWQDTNNIACDSLLQLMLDQMIKVLRGLQNAGMSQGRIFWTPHGQAQRLLDSVRLLTYPHETIVDDVAGLQIIVGLDSPLPYAEDAAQTLTTFSGTTTLTNGGTADFWPVFRVSGTGAFSLQNSTVLDANGNPLKLVWAGSLGGGYVEIDMFRNTMFLNGNGADLLSGVDFSQSDFFPLAPGPNSISLSSGSADALYQAAWG